MRIGLYAFGAIGMHLAIKTNSNMYKKNFIVAVDLQNDFIDGALGSEQAQSIIPNVVKYIKETRAHIIFTRDTHDDNYLYTHEGNWLSVKHCIKNTSGWELNRDVRYAVEHSRCTYSVVDKSSFGTSKTEEIIRCLLEYIQSGGEWHDYSDTKGKELNITIFGLDTDICVISNALMLRSAFPEADINVIACCCAGTTPEKHEAALQVMESCHINVDRTNIRG